MTDFIRRIINFEAQDWAIVQQVARQMGLDELRFSAAVRQIIRQWAAEHLPAPLPVHAPEPPGRIDDVYDEEDQDDDR
jgi:hypothetical protein